MAIRRPQQGHRVEDLAHQLYLDPLSAEGLTSHTLADDRFVSVHGVLDHAVLAVARGRVPLAPPEFLDRTDVAISFLQCRRGFRAELGIAYLYWLRFGYFIAGGSGVEGFTSL